MHQGQQEKNIDILKKGIKQQSLINIQGWTLNLNWSDKKDKELTRLFRNKFNSIQSFGPQCNVFFPTCHALKTWFEISRVKL